MVIRKNSFFVFDVFVFFQQALYREDLPPPIK